MTMPYLYLKIWIVKRKKKNLNCFLFANRTKSTLLNVVDKALCGEPLMDFSASSRKLPALLTVLRQPEVCWVPLPPSCFTQEPLQGACPSPHLSPSLSLLDSIQALLCPEWLSLWLSNSDGNIGLFPSHYIQILLCWYCIWSWKYLFTHLSPLMVCWLIEHKDYVL